MEFKLRTNKKYNSTIEQLLYARGFELPNEMDLFLHPRNSAEYNYLRLDNIEIAARRILKSLVRQERVYIQVDSDCDGYTSAALLLNFCHRIAPSVVENNWYYSLHTRKIHGIDMEKATEQHYDLVIAPDSSSNEKDKHIELTNQDCDVLVIDHHEASGYEDDPAIIINNQLCNYPNKFLSGVGVVYKVCQCMDIIAGTGYSIDYLDLVALGLLGDMMDMRQLETRYYITEGLENVTNPFFKYLADKNEYSMKGEYNPHTVSWYIAPFINAVTRIGNYFDKQLVFESMLEWKAGELIQSDKRGAIAGTEELRVIQAIRHSANVKRHQDEDKKKLLEQVEIKIQELNLLEEPLLIIQNKGIDEDDPTRGITGLVANSLCAKYNKPTLVLNEIIDQETGEVTWSGSGRGFPVSGIDNWRDYINNCGCAIFAQGHPFAFGVAFSSDGLHRFKEYCRKQFGTTKFEQTYTVDFIWTMMDEFDNIVMEIGEYGNIWGQGVPEPLVVIEHIKIDGKNVKLNLLNKGTLRLDLTPHKTTCIKFGSSAEEYESLLGKTITIVGTCSINEWNGNYAPQIQLKDYMIETVPVWDF